MGKNVQRSKVRTCLKCGFKNPGGFKYCGNCGTTLTLETDSFVSLITSLTPDTIRAKILSLKNSKEQRLVYILLARISNVHSASLHDNKNTQPGFCVPYESLINITHKYEGIVSSVSKMEMVALFGVAIAHEDDAERAVSAALDMLAMIDRYNDEHSCNVLLTVGIHTGNVLLKHIGPDLTIKYKSVGNTITRVKKLVKNMSGKIHVSDEIYRKINHLYEVDEWKTRMNSPASFVVKGIKEIFGRKYGTVESQAPFIGRTKEIDMLNAGFEKLFDLKSIVVTVTGEAGIGKSRLIEEFKRITGNRANWLSGRCLSYGQSFSFWVFLEQIRSYLGVRDFDIETESSRKLDGKAEQLFKERADEYLPYLCVFLSIKVLEHLQDKIKYLDPESLRLQEFISVQAFFREIVSNKPLVLYFEDMQWVDPESLDLMRYLLEGLTDVPICFLFETRPEEGAGVYKLRDIIQNLYKDCHIEIDLNPLGTGDIKTLVSNLLHVTPSEELCSLVLEKSEGNPFFVEEIIRSLKDSGILMQTNETWCCATEIAEIELPDSVDSLIRSRIDRLPDELQRILSCAAVIGKKFHQKLLCDVFGESNLDENLLALEEKAFIFRLNEHVPQSPNAQYSFRHGLLRDVIYGVLPEKTKKLLHKKVAVSIESLFNERIEEYYDILAYHYYHAHVFEKAYDFFVKAGDRAKSLYSNDSAVELYTRALQIREMLYTKDRNQAELFEKRGDIREIKAEYDEAVSDYRGAFEIFQHPEKKADILRKTGRVYRQKSEYKIAREYFKKAIDSLENQQHSPVYLNTMLEFAFIKRALEGEHYEAQRLVQFVLEHLDKTKYAEIYAHGLLTLGFLIQFTGNYNEVLEYYREALELYEKHNEKRGIGIACNNLGLIYAVKGEFDTALDYYKRYLTITQEIGDKREQMTACNHIGRIYRMRGDFDIALRYYQRHFTIAQEIGHVKNLGLAYLTNGYIYYTTGEYSTALDYFEKYRKISEDIGDKPGIGIAHQRLSMVYMTMHEFKKAHKHIERAIEVFRSINAAVKASEAYSIRAEIYIMQNQHGEAVMVARKALSLALKEPVAIQQVIALRTLGKVEALLDPSAIHNLEKSHELAITYGMQLEAARSLYELADACQRKGAIDRAMGYAQQAYLIYKQSGIKPDLERTQALIDLISRACAG